MNGRRHRQGGAAWVMDELIDELRSAVSFNLNQVVLRTPSARLDVNRRSPSADVFLLITYLQIDKLVAEREISFLFNALLR